jgi:PAS domain S-box-containing protein
MMTQTMSADPILADRSRVQGWAVESLSAGQRFVLDESLAAQAQRSVPFQPMDDVIWILDPRTQRLLYVSPSVERLQGFTPEEIMARPFQSLLSPDLWWPLKRLIRRQAAALRSGETPADRCYTTEIELPRKGGGTVWTRTVARMAVDPRTGHAIVQGVTRDVGERKAAQAALAESQRRYAFLTDNLPGFAYRCRKDAGWTCEFVSAGCLALTGYSVQELLELGGAWHARILHPEDRDRLWGEVRAALEARGRYELEYRIVAACGEARWVWERGCGVYGRLGELLAMEGVVLDIDRYRRADAGGHWSHEELERRVRERTAALEEANAELESFAYSVSHDLRAPLRAIRGFAEVLKRHYRDRLDGDGQRFIDNVSRAGERMGALIDDLLLYARTGRGSVRAVPVPLGPLLAELRASFAERIAACGAELTVSEPLATPRGDPTLIRQVLSNLLENALIYRCSQDTPRIALSAVVEGSDVAIRVADNGIGIAPENHRRVFEAFQRLHSQDAYPGTGIGLAIVSKATRSMGGQVELSSVPGRGSTFCVRLPAV